MKYFADKGADINLVDESGMNCLHIAAKNGHLSLCKTLIDKYKFDVDNVNNEGQTALLHSARSGSYELFTYFVDIGANIECKNNLGWNSLHIAARYGHFNLCKRLVNKHKFNVQLVDKDGWRSLHHSARSGSYELFTYFVDMGADIECKNNLGWNCLHIAAQNGHLKLCKKLIDRHKLDLHLADKDGWTALHHSARNGSYELVMFFVDMGIDFKSKNHLGENCLHIAGSYGHVDLCKRLINKHNFDVELTDNDGWRPLHHSARSGCYWLFKYFADMVTNIGCENGAGLNCLHIAAKNEHLNFCKKLIEKHNFDLDLPDFDGWTALHHSARNGSYELLRYFADMGADVNLKDNLGMNCLHIAAKNGHSNLFKTLIDKYKFNVEMVDNEGWTALQVAARNGSYDLVRSFVDNVEDLKLVNNLGLKYLHVAAENGDLNLCKRLIHNQNVDCLGTGNKGWTVLHYSAVNGSYKLIKYFADMGADIKCKNNLGWNCLHIAAQNGHLKLCQILIDRHNFDIHLADKDGWTALHHSARNGSYELVKYFSNIGTFIESKVYGGLNCLHIAAQNGHLKLCEKLVDKHNFDVALRDFDGWTVLHHSARNGSYELFTFFVGKRVDIECKNNLGENSLHIAARYGHFHLCKRLINEHEFDVRLTDNDGWRPLHHSARSSSYMLLNYFVNMGIDIDCKNDAGLNCLHIATKNGNLNLCKKLIDKYNFDVDLPDFNGWTVLHHSARNGSYDLVKYFADKGADINLGDESGMNCLHIAAKNGHLNLCKDLIDKYEFDVDVSDNEGRTALHISVQIGSYDLVKYFADMGAEVKLKDNSGMNCLHIAAKNGHLNLCRKLIDKYKFDVDSVNNEGQTALHISAENGSYYFVNCFADIGADIKLKNDSGMNCLHIAAINLHLNLCKILIEKYQFDVDMADNEGRTALHIAAENCSYDLIKYFTDMGSDIKLENNLSLKCLYIAAENGDLNLCKKFIEKCNVDCLAADNKGWTALHHSAKNGSYELITYFTNIGSDIESKNKLGWNCLHIAAQNGHLKLCQILIDRHKLDIHLADKNGWTALHHSAKSGSYELVTYFTDMGPDIRSKVYGGLNCLHIAAQNGHLKLCKKLINIHTFDVNLPDYDGWTALHHSARSGSYELLTYFVDMESDIECTNELGWNSLHIAARYGHLNLCKRLVNKHEFNVLLKDNNRWRPLHHSARYGSYWLLKYFADMGTNIDSRDDLGWNCLHIAAKNGHLNLCRKLVDKYKLHLDLRDYNGWTALHHCAVNGSYDLVKTFAGMGADINLQDNSGMNCLHIAAKHGHLNLCKTLIDTYKFDVNIADNDGRTALHISVRNGSYALVRYFASMGADTKLDNDLGLDCLYVAAQNGDFNLCKTLIDNHKVDCLLTDNKGWTALHHSAINGSFKLIKYFADMGADIKCKNSLEWNCLHIAAQNGHLKLCQILIDRHNFDIHLADKDGWTALHHSARNGSYELVKYFSNIGTFIESKVYGGLNCLHIAAQNGHLKLCEKLVDKHNFDVALRDFDGWTVLHHSARNGSYELFTFFVGKRVDIECKNNLGENSLHIAARYGHFHLCKRLINEHEFDVRLTDNDGWRPLHHSARSSSYMLLNYFVNMGIDIDCKNDAGLNCLHIATKNGNLNLCKKLIDKYNFDVDLPDFNGWTVLHHSARNGSYDLVKYFADKGADINLGDESGMNCLHIAAKNGHLNLCKDLIDKYEFDVDVSDNEGRTALHISVQIGSYDLVKYFADMGAEVKLKDNSGMNCLHIAAKNGHLNLCRKLIDKYKFDVDSVNNEGQTALHISAENGSYYFVNCFADIGADIKLKNDSGMNCLHIAAINLHLNLCKILIEKYQFDVDMADNEGRTALHIAAENCSYDLIKYFTDMGSDIKLENNLSLKCLYIAAENGDLNLCKKFIEKCNVDCLAADNKGWTALHHSAKNGSYELITYFTNIGSDIESKNKLGWNCLHIAAQNGHLKLCQILIDRHKLDIHLADKNGWTALHHSAKSGSYELVTYFTDMGPDIRSKVYGGLNCLHIAAQNGHLKLCKKLINIHTFDVNLPDYDGWTALHHSARSGSYELLTYFVDMESDIECTNELGWNSLHIAARYGHLNLCKRLVNKHKLDVQQTDNGRWRPLHHSAISGSLWVLEYFADIGNDIYCKNDVGWNCLHIAAHNGYLSLCRKLIDKYMFHVDTGDYKGRTALHLSARKGSYDLVKYFADMGADMNLKDKSGMNCLHIAAECGHLSLCKRMVYEHSIDVHITDNKGWTAFHHSAKKGYTEFITYFADMGTDISCKNDIGWNCLHIAAKKGYFPLCKTLVEKYKFEVDMTDSKGRTALHISATYGSSDLVTYFARVGADINLRDDSGRNCLHVAAKNGHLDLCKTLIDQYRLDVDMTDNKGRTPLHYSARSSNNLFRYFADIRSDVNLVDNSGLNCLHIAAQNGKINLCVELIDKYNFDCLKADNRRWTALHHSARNGSYKLVKYFASLGTDIGLRTNSNMNCLHIAACYGNLDLCRALVDEHNFDVHMTDNDGWSAYHHSARNGSVELIAYFANMKINIQSPTKLGWNCLHIAAYYRHLELCKKLLDKYNFDVGQPDNNGWTALHHSARIGSYELVNFFTDRGTDIDSKNNLQWNSLHIAAKYGHFELCKKLVNKYNFDVLTPDNDGWTVLHHSARKGSYELISFFVNMGSDIMCRNNIGLNCLHVAARYGALGSLQDTFR